MTALEASIIGHFYEYVEDMCYFPQELYTKLVAQLQQAYLDETEDDPDALKSVEEMEALGCRYSFPEIED